MQISASETSRSHISPFWSDRLRPDQEKRKLFSILFIYSCTFMYLHKKKYHAVLRCVLRVRVWEREREGEAERGREREGVDQPFGHFHFALAASWPAAVSHTCVHFNPVTAAWPQLREAERELTNSRVWLTGRVQCSKDSFKPCLQLKLKHWLSAIFSFCSFMVVLSLAANYFIVWRWVTYFWKITDQLQRGCIFGPACKSKVSVLTV